MRNLVLGILMVFVATVSLADTVGTVKNLDGTAEIVRNGTVMSATQGTKIVQGDVIRTGKDSNIGIMMKDESRMVLGSNSRMAVEKFTFNHNTHEGNMLINITKGTFAMLSGLLTKHQPETAIVKTPTSTAGIRGTYFYVEVP